MACRGNNIKLSSVNMTSFYETKDLIENFSCLIFDGSKDMSLLSSRVDYDLIKRMRINVPAVHGVLTLDIYTKLSENNSESDMYNIMIMATLNIQESKRKLSEFSIKLKFNNNLKELLPFQKELFLKSSNAMVNIRQITSMNVNSIIKCDYSVCLTKKVLKDEFVNEILDLENYWNSTKNIHKKSKNQLFNFTFKVKNDRFEVHKEIMMEASDVMKTMFSGNYNESHEKSTIIGDIEADVFELMINFIYGDRQKFILNARTELLFELFDVAHKYNLTKLENYCLARIFKELTDTEDVLDTYSFAWKYNLDELKVFCWDVIHNDILEHFVSKEPIPPLKVKNLQNHMKKVEDLVNEWNDLKNRIQKQLTFDLSSENLDKDSVIKSVTFENKFDLRI